MTNLVWLDLEMTGLCAQTCKIIEIACVITDENLNIVQEAPNLAIYQKAAILAQMDDWCTKTHTQSGLVARVQQSQIDEAQAEQIMLDFIAQYVEPKKSPLCGNSIGQDRMFLKRYMPKLEDYFHYRNLDVSSLKILANLWSDLAPMTKANSHKALDDVYESISELKYYKKHLFKL